MQNTSTWLPEVDCYSTRELYLATMLSRFDRPSIMIRSNLVFPSFLFKGSPERAFRIVAKGGRQMHKCNRRKETGSKLRGFGEEKPGCEERVCVIACGGERKGVPICSGLQQGNKPQGSHGGHKKAERVGVLFWEERAPGVACWILQPSMCFK